MCFPDSCLWQKLAPVFVLVYITFVKTLTGAEPSFYHRAFEFGLVSAGLLWAVACLSSFTPNLEYNCLTFPSTLPCFLEADVWLDLCGCSAKRGRLGLTNLTRLVIKQACD